MNRSSRRESALISLEDGSRWREVIRLTPDATGFMESSLFLSDLLTGHEPKMCKFFEIKERIFRFMGSLKALSAP